MHAAGISSEIYLKVGFFLLKSDRNKRTCPTDPRWFEVVLLGKVFPLQNEWHYDPPDRFPFPSMLAVLLSNKMTTTEIGGEVSFFSKKEHGFHLAFILFPL